jgi:hypothetical protein
VSKFRSVHSKWVGRVAAVVALPCAALLGTSLWDRFHNETIDLRYSAIAEARLVAAKIDRHFDTIENLLGVLSTAVSTNPSDVDANDALLRRSKSEAPRFIANIILLSLDGKNIGNAVGQHASAGDRNYFQRAKAGTSFVVEDPIRSRSNIGWVIPAARPIRDSAGEVQAVLVAATFLESLPEMIGINERSMGQTIRVVNDRGIEIASNSTSSALVEKDLIQVSPDVRQTRLKEGSEVVALNGDATHVVGFSATHRVPWLVTVGLPMKFKGARLANDAPR